MIIWGVLLGSIFGAALFSPMIFQLIHYYLQYDPWPFSRVFDRVILVFLIILFVFLRKKLKFSFFSELGFKNKGGRLKDFSVGTCLSLVISIAAMFLLVWIGNLYWIDLPLSFLIGVILKASLTALIVSFLEETVFRGLIFSAMSVRLGAKLAILITSFIYATVHFLKPDKQFIFTKDLFIGFDYVLHICSRVFSVDVLPGIFGLFLIGLILNWLFYKTGSLFPSIGLHAGWVIASKIIPAVTDISPLVLISPIIGTRYYLVSEQLGWISIIMVGILAHLIFVVRRIKL